MVIIAIILIIAAIAISVSLWAHFVNKKYQAFLMLHSVSLKKLSLINQKYVFNDVPVFSYAHSYDNENFYARISPKDYLVYQLIYAQGSIESAMTIAKKNAKAYVFYTKEVKEAFGSGVYDTDELLQNTKRLLKIEKQMYQKSIREPVLSVEVSICLSLTHMSGRYRTAKNEVFDEKQIQEIINRLRLKKNGRYLDEEIWKSICRVERGKVTNKMRFAIYRRDNYRCRMCGASTKNLEIDHIFPISKGGKSNFENLQTLCHKCNAHKSNSIIRTSDMNAPNVLQCPNCSIPLVLREGKNGKFYGCMNYPKCRCTKPFYPK